MFLYDGHQFQQQLINWNVAIDTYNRKVKFNGTPATLWINFIRQCSAHIDFITSCLAKHIQNDGGKK